METGNILVPSSAKWLGALGAIPFVAIAVAVPVVPDHMRPAAVHALAAYGATILSFLGGVHWGLGIKNPDERNSGKPWIQLTVSVIPPLVGWAALIVSNTVGLLILAAAFAAMLWVDIRATRLGAAPKWYPNLRIPLTCVVTGALLFGALA